MFAQVTCPENLNPADLDGYLERGWFRMGQSIFTTNFLNFKGQYYSALWLRIALDEYSGDSTERKLGKLNRRFRHSIRKASITAEKETLFLKYRENVSFEASPSLHHLLMGKSSTTIFDTYEVCLYDGNTLIAVGYFDQGRHASAGIISFYDPSYKKFSLGKYLIYLKVAHAKQTGMQFFYPGYFVPGYKLFDYKLSIGKAALYYLEFQSNSWRGIQHFREENTPLQVLQEKLKLLTDSLSETKLKGQLLYYEFFDVNIIPDLKGALLFDFPLFIGFYNIIDLSINPIVVFDLTDLEYHILKCQSVWYSNTDNTDTLYSSSLLKVDEMVYRSPLPEDIAAFLSTQLRETNSGYTPNS
jgi:leucyl-tRNA---protein transferase